MNLESALQTFVTESHELLQEMESLLLNLNLSRINQEDIDSLFRAVHTIKGSAGLFGLDAVVGFTHVVESALDLVRIQELELNDKLVNLLLNCKDFIEVQISSIKDGVLVLDEVFQKQEQHLLRQLGSCSDKLKSSSAKQLEKQLEKELCAGSNASVCVTESAEQVSSENWHISLCLSRDVFRHGMDPLSFIRYLATLGTIQHIATVFNEPEDDESIKVEDCYLGFEISFQSDEDKSTIEEVFEFLSDNCSLRILPPKCLISEFVALINNYAKDNIALGQILLECGTLTDQELQTVLAQQSNLAYGGEAKKIGELVVENGLSEAGVVQAALEKQEQLKANRNRTQQSIRVDSRKLDDLITLIGEMVIAGSGLDSEIRETGISHLNEASLPLVRLIEEVRECALGLRMVQIGETFSRFQRVVRDVSAELGKRIQLDVVGAETELDKTVIEKISDPLVHLVRNAIDHGIEKPDVRKESGKPEFGRITLKAFHESGSVVIEISDDGKGLDADKIYQKAEHLGLINSGAVLSETEIFQLIFEPGFSTAQEVSNISGRGVGMDVVRKNIESLHGSIELDSRPGFGTRFKIRLPLTLAIIDGFLVRVGSGNYVIPLDMVVECIELSEADRRDMHLRNYLRLRGEALPFIRLSEVFNIEDAKTRRESIVVVRHGKQRLGIAVDRLLGEFQTVIKPLNIIFESLAGVGGSTILGSGEVALILDIPSLVTRIEQAECQKFPEAKYGSSNSF